MAVDNLKQRAVRGSVIIGVVSMLTRPLNIVASFLLARLLDPTDFGMVALGMLMATSAYLFIDLGMGPALIQTDMDRKRIVFPMFVVTILFGSLITGLIIWQSESLAVFLGEVNAAPALRWLAWMVLIEAALTIPEALLSKGLHFAQIGSLRLFWEVSHLIISVTLAYLGYGMWSLIYAKLISGVLQLTLTWIFCPGWEWLIPRWPDFAAMRKLLRFGLQSTVGGVISFLHMNWDDWLVGRVFGASALGLYTKAYALSNDTLSSLSRNVINGVFFPSYSKMQNDKPRLARVYLKSLNFVFFLMIPIALGMLVVAPQLVSVLMGPKWLPAIPVLQIYAALILTRPISSNTYPLFMALGLPNYNVRAGGLLLGIMVPCVLGFVALGWNIAGVALGVVIAHTIAACYNVYQVHTLLPGTAQQTLRSMIPPLSAGLAMFGSVHLSKPFVLQLVGCNWNILGLVLLIVIGSAVYLGLNFILQRAVIGEMLQLALTAVVGKRRLARAAAKP